jgi:TIR domain-containing protein
LIRRDVFISHASEDKEVIARPLARQLTARGVSVWFDEYELGLGDSLRGRISDGLRQSRVGVVILSHSFFSRQWPRWELDGLTARWIAGEANVILPVWHDVELEDVRSYSPPLADLVAARSSGGVDSIADQIVQVLGKIAAGEEPQAALSALEDPLSTHERPLPARIFPRAAYRRGLRGHWRAIAIAALLITATVLAVQLPSGPLDEHLRTGSITLTDEQNYDIDTEVVTGFDADIYFPTDNGDNSFLLGPASGGVYATPRSTASRDTCKHALEHEHSSSVDLTKKQRGYSFCLLTTEKHIAVMTLADKSTLTEPHELTLKYQLYK